MEQQHVFILHKRPFKESSFILELLSRELGRVAVVARGAKKARAQGDLQLFTRMCVSWTGRSDLKTLTYYDSEHSPIKLQGRALLCAFYVNELLIRALAHHDPHSEVFDDYQLCLQRLVSCSETEACLRWFEKRLLDNLGYGFLLHEESNGEPIEADKYYHFIPEQGLRLSRMTQEYQFLGSSILALHADRLMDQVTLRDAKRLLRSALPILVGDKPFASRDLFTMPQEEPV